MTKRSSRAVHSALADIPECYRDIENWPNVDESLIEDAAKQKRYQRLSKAMGAYLQGEGLSEAAGLAKLSASRFLALLRRCLQPSFDGGIWGCRALISGARVKPLQRKKIFTQQESAKAGFQGMFGLLLTTHPEIETSLHDFVRAKKGRLRLNKVTFRAMHQEFLKACQKAGVQPSEYPFNTDRQAREPLRIWLKTHFSSMQGEAWIQATEGEDAAQAFGYQDGDGQAMRAYSPYLVWIIDETSIDLEAIYELPNARGDWEEIQLRRACVIRVRDAGTGANLASRVVYGPQASAEDISMVLQRAIMGSRVVSRAREAYAEGAGFPADMIPELQYAVPVIVLLDNALSHLADHTQHICQFLFGGKSQLGKAKTPQARPEVEAALSKIASRLIHQLPGTTGSGPKDPVRRTAAVPPKNRIRLDKLDDAIEAYCANENAMPASASRYISPLERLRRQVLSGALKPVYLPATKRHPHYFGKASMATVHASSKSGRRPHINYLGARYTGSWLTSNYALVGSKVWVRANFDDLRTVLLFDAKGNELGSVQALGQWGKFPHDIRIRKQYLKLKKRNELGPRADDDPLAFLFNHLRLRASGDRTAALQVTHIVEYLRRQADLAGVQLAEEYASWEDACKAADAVGLLPQVDPSNALPLSPAPIPTVFGNKPADSGSANDPESPTNVSSIASGARDGIGGALISTSAYLRPLARRIIRH
ncbi:hypothetical protein AB4Y42_20275 [Paraburkholderia sp. EG286B]|uniref:hypothetical protein n=1 Tax=Paraburkholderia sp. EG286B TaxID=3237011 RepID=UPI0034D307A7